MTFDSSFKRVAIFTDFSGWESLKDLIPKSKIACLVGSCLRKEDLETLEEAAEIDSFHFLIQPTQKSKDFSQFLQDFQKLSPDLIFCRSYSLLIPDAVLKTVNDNAINLHPALLPKNRGPNPIQWAIIKGEIQTGVTLHCMNQDFDSGDIITQQKVEIAFEDTWVDLKDKLFTAAQELLSKELPKILSGQIQRVSQDEKQASQNSRITSDFPQIDFKTMSDLQIYNLIRAQVSPLQGAFVLKEGKRIHFDQKLSLEEIKALRSQFVS